MKSLTYKDCNLNPYFLGDLEILLVGKKDRTPLVYQEDLKLDPILKFVFNDLDLFDFDEDGNTVYVEIMLPDTAKDFETLLFFINHHTKAGYQLSQYVVKDSETNETRIYRGLSAFFQITEEEVLEVIAYLNDSDKSEDAILNVILSIERIS